MIHSRKQLTAAQKGITTLQERIEALKNSQDMTDLLQVHAWKCRIEDLTAEIDEFENLSNATELEFSAENIQKAIISLRIASGLTQKQLADAIDVQEQQIQRYEQNYYQTAGFERIIQIMRVLSTNIQLKVSFEKEQKESRFECVYEKYPAIKQEMARVCERKMLMAC